jgi:NDP-sugar pyrophosphorylase family protein
MTQVIIMAGGRGLRLHPLTEHQPKPMLPIKGKPLLETIIDSYAVQGIKDFTLCVNYRKDVIKKHFQNGGLKGLRITYIEEDEPLGTAGALRNLEIPSQPAIVTNADVITKIDVVDLIKAHYESGAMATMCVAEHLQQIRFGVVKTSGDRVIGIDEKPIIDYPVAAGINVLSPASFERLNNYDAAERKLTYLDMPDFLLSLPSLSAYFLKETWQDVGTFEDYARANGD